jgi:mannose-6-phosphate isomerase class I
MRRSNYDKRPCVKVTSDGRYCAAGFDAIAVRLRAMLATRSRAVLVIDCYPGVDVVALRRELSARLSPTLVVDASEAMLPAAAIDALVVPFLGGDDPVFGFVTDLTLPQFFDPASRQRLRARIDAVSSGLVLVLGTGSRLLADGDVLVYADLPRWEAQLRFRRNETGNLGVDNRTVAAGPKYKRAYFVDWRVADAWKRPLLATCDFVLDTTVAAAPLLATGDAVRAGLRAATQRPFRVVPFFDPAPWGGQWMKEVCDLDRSAPNYGWCFDCVPEENSLLLGFGDHVFELPAIDLVHQQPRALLGRAVQERFGAEFPIRFDFLDTMGGGNLSFQVHPRSEYIQKHFGMPYTQDESYYLLDAGPDASVYLGLRDDIDPAAMLRELAAAQAGGAPFDVERHAHRWPGKRHDHLLIPAGTVHCSGKDAMVLEISATPFVFTFKLWDWGRMGLDGKPRPIHLQHGAANVQWERTTAWTRRNLVNRIEPVASGDGWREERTGLHELEFLETRRHWFQKPVVHDTRDTVHVLNLVAGEEAIVDSPDGAFAPYVVHYAETFVVPAAIGPYRIQPHGLATGHECATMQASVRP